ncbi:MAG: CRP-like cAMP-binding protein [Desulforhopalus sp.]
MSFKSKSHEKFGLEEGTMPMQPDENTVEMLAGLIAEIEHAVEVGDFQTAKSLRDTLIENNPMAISEGIKTAEMIEEGMSAAIDQYHLAIWPGLYDQLSIEERNCLFFSMKQYVLPEKRLLLKYGSVNNRLFFLEKGSVSVGIPQDDNKIKIVAELGRGDIIGDYTFATMALCSASVVTKTKVQVRCLEAKLAELWDEEHPGLYAKVMDFCKNHGQVGEIIARKEQEIHHNPRHSVDALVKAFLLDENDQATEVSFNGELEEISRSGCSFAIHCNQSSIVKKLLARSFSLNFCCNKNGKEIKFSCRGSVVKVTSILHNDYQLHISFPKYLPENIVAQLAV